MNRIEELNLKEGESEKIKKAILHKEGEQMRKKYIFNLFTLNF